MPERWIRVRMGVTGFTYLLRGIEALRGLWVSSQ